MVIDTLLAFDIPPQIGNLTIGLGFVYSCTNNILKGKSILISCMGKQLYMLVT